MTDWLLILAGFVLLLGSAEYLVRGAVWCALVLGITPMTIGLTLVAFGTSAPELFVSLTAAAKGAPDIAIGSVLGSNIANIGLIIGCAALLKPIEHGPRSARFESGMLLLCSALILVPIGLGLLAAWHGAVLLMMLAGFTGWLVLREKGRAKGLRTPNDEQVATPEVPTEARRGPGQTFLHLGMVLGGLIGLKFGGDFLVDGASNVATDLGMSEFLIGQTVIAIGTSLPELATSVVAARRGHPEIALGNVLGSNIFNICMVLGATAMLHPLKMSFDSQGPAALLGLAMAVVLTLLIRRFGRIGRLPAALLLVTWIGYILSSIFVTS